MKFSAAEKAIGNLNERRAFQQAIFEAMQMGVTADDVSAHIKAIDAAITELRAVMPAPVTSTTPKKPRAARKPKKGAAE